MMRSPSYAVFVIGFFMLFCSVAVPEATATLLDRNLNNFNNDNNMGSLRHERLHSAVRSSLIRWDHILSGPHAGDGGHNLFVRDSDDATVKCVNGGVLPPDAEGNSEARCICPLSYTGQTCSERQCPNSIDGEGPFGIRPVNPENQLCDQCHRDMFDGINCQLCKQNAACNSYTGKGSRCDTGFAIQGNEKQFQCSLDAPYFINLMGDGRNITSDIMLNWTTTDGKAFGTHDNGLCHMAIYRREPEDSYLDPFFRCDASECSYHFDEEEGHANTNNTSARETRVQVFFRFVRLAGQVVLMLLCLALTVLSCFSSSLGPKRMKKLTIYISAALVLITLLYIFAMVISVRPAHAAQTVVFQCKHTRCACAEDPPEQFQPICSHSPVLNEAILPSIRNSIRLICSVETKRCSLNLDDLNLVFDSTCEASECVDEDVFPDRSGSTHTKGDTRRLTILRFLVYLVSATGVGVAVHALILYLQSRRRRKEFTKIFHLLDLRRAAATAGDGGAGTTTMETAMLLPPTAATRVLPPLEEEEEFAGDECTNSHPPHHDQEEGQGHPSNNSLVHVVTVDRDGSEARSSSHRGGSRARPGETAAVASETGVAAPTTIVITAQGGGGGGGGGEEEEDEEGGGEETDPLLPSVSSPPRPPVTGGDELEVTSVLSDHTRASVEALRRDCRSILCLEAHGLRYTLPVSRFAEETETRQILQNINFTVNSGDVVAIMGPSGAGKSTLLDLISTRGKSGEVGGELRVNDTCITSNQRSTTTTSNGAASSNVSPGTLKRQYRNLIGYVSQDDTLLPTLTVRQTITYAARLKLPSVFSPVMIKDIVSLTIRALKLERCADTLIGDGSSLRGVSGGERRRVSIAVELLANPRILLLDEPTSGLDSVSAKTVMEAIATVAKDSPMRVYAPYYFAFKPIVLFSIHQPSIDIYNLFDKVLLLSQGWSVYSGTAGDAAPVLLHRINEAFGYARCDPESFRGQNPAEFLLKLEDQMDDAVRQRLQQYNTSDHHRRPLWAARRENTPITLEENTARAPAAAGGGGLTQHISGEVDDAGTLWRGSTGSSGGSHSGMGVMVSGERLLSTTAALRRFYANVYQQLDILISRSCACLLGSFSLIACHAGVVACLSVLLCTVYQSQGLDLPGALNRAGCITFLLLVTSFMSLSCLEALIVERRLFLEERENGFYSTFPYLVSKLVVDILPFRAVPAMVLGSIIYFPMGFRADQGWSFFYFISILVLFSVDITLLTLCIGIVSSAFGSAALLSSVMILLNFVFGGAMVQAGTLPPFLQGIQRLSPFFLAFEALMVNELDGQACTFSPTDETGKPSASFPIMCRQYLANEGLQPSRWSEDIIQLCLYSVFLLVFACILMSYWTKLVR